jgi:predicted metalloprotease
MSFIQEQTGYQKTILSDLQGAWSNLLDQVLQLEPSDETKSIVFQIHEATSWESVRYLTHMRNVFIVIRNKITKVTSEESIESTLEDLAELLDEAILEYESK